MEYAYTCWTCNDSSPLRSTEKDAHVAAANDGWGLGHENGQAHYTCSYCAPALFGVILLSKIKY